MLIKVDQIYPPMTRRYDTPSPHPSALVGLAASQALPIHIAAAYSLESVCRLLLADWPASLLELSELDGKTPLQMAEAVGTPTESMLALLSHSPP